MVECKKIVTVLDLKNRVITHPTHIAVLLAITTAINKIANLLKSISRKLIIIVILHVINRSYR